MVNRAQAGSVVVLPDVHAFLLRCHAPERYAVVEPAVNADQATVLLLPNQIKGEVAEGHRDDRIESIGIARAHQITEPLVHHVDAPPLVVFWGRFLQRRPDPVPNPTYLAVPVL